MLADTQMKLFAIAIGKLIRTMGHPSATCRSRCDWSYQAGQSEFGVAVFVDDEPRTAVKFWRLDVSILEVAAKLASWLNENRPSASIPAPF